jgi:hypothetical protein
VWHKCKCTASPQCRRLSQAPAAAVQAGAGTSSVAAKACQGRAVECHGHVTGRPLPGSMLRIQGYITRAQQFGLTATAANVVRWAGAHLTTTTWLLAVACLVAASLALPSSPATTAACWVLLVHRSTGYWKQPVYPLGVLLVPGTGGPLLDTMKWVRCCLCVLMCCRRLYSCVSNRSPPSGGLACVYVFGLCERVTRLCAASSGMSVCCLGLVDSALLQPLGGRRAHHAHLKHHPQFRAGLMRTQTAPGLKLWPTSAGAMRGRHSI